jgi:hypothetical protein
MNSRAANSGGSASPVPPPPPHEFYVVLPDGSCIPATPKTCRIVMKQARDEARKQAKIKRHEKAVEVQMALEDRAAARRLMQELAELDRDLIRYAARFRVRIRPDKPDTRTSPIVKRLTITPMHDRSLRLGMEPTASSWVIDDRGMRGIIWQQSYLGRKSADFYRGAARDNWEYDVRDEAVVLGPDGEPIIISNMGDDWVEIGVGWQAMEDASTRKNAKIQIRAIAPFDADMSLEEMTYALEHFCKTVLEPLGLPYSAVIHRPSADGDQRNFHPHLSFSLRPMRRVAPYTYEIADEVRGELDGKDGVQMLRHLWAHSMTAAAERAGSNRAYTGLGYGARGLDLEAGEHLGEGRSAILRRGETVWADKRNRIKNARNAARRAIRDADRKIEALTKLRDAVVAQMSRKAEDISPPKVLVASAMPQRAAKLTSAASRPSRLPEAMTLSRFPTPPGRRQAATGDIGHARSFLPTMPRATVQPPLKVSGPAADHPPRWLEAAGIVPPAPPLRVALPTPSLPRRLVAAKGANEAMPRLEAAGQAVSISAGSGKGLSVAEPVGPVATPLSAAKSIEPPKILARSKAVGATLPNDIVVALLHALAQARRRRAERRRAARWRDTRRRDEPIPTLADIPTREQFEAQPRVNLFAIPPADRPVADPAADERRQADERLIARILKADVYIADMTDDALSVHWTVTEKLGIDDAWMQQSHVQRAFSDIRRNQQRVIAALRNEAVARPLEFSAISMRFWPADLDPAGKARLDRWATDDGFMRDVSAIRAAIGAAHSAEKRAKASTANRVRTQQIGVQEGATGGPATGSTTHQRKRSVGDSMLEGVRIRAFLANSGRPTKSLLMLIRYAGEHPNHVGGVSGDAMEANDSAPVAIRTLVEGWCHDARVKSLVAMTVKASRHADRPVWPSDIASDIRATVADNPWPSWSPHDVGLSRS